ncbi:MAG: hypothetical protein AB7V40_00560 [Methyloceanibacter sp.]
MLKKVFLASAMSLLVAGVTLTAAPSESFACKSHCFKKAKAKYGHGHFKDRHAYRKACHKAHKAAKK